METTLPNHNETAEPVRLGSLASLLDSSFVPPPVKYGRAYINGKPVGDVVIPPTAEPCPVIAAEKGRNGYAKQTHAIKQYFDAMFGKGELRTKQVQFMVGVANPPRRFLLSLVELGFVERIDYRTWRWYDHKTEV